MKFFVNSSRSGLGCFRPQFCSVHTLQEQRSFGRGLGLEPAKQFKMEVRDAGQLGSVIGAHLVLLTVVFRTLLSYRLGNHLQRLCYRHQIGFNRVPTLGTRGKIGHSHRFGYLVGILGTVVVFLRGTVLIFLRRSAVFVLFRRGTVLVFLRCCTVIVFFGWRTVIVTSMPLAARRSTASSMSRT